MILTFTIVVPRSHFFVKQKSTANLAMLFESESISWRTGALCGPL